MFILNSCTNIAENSLNQSLISPNGKYVAVSFIRSVGATTAYSPQVSILRKNKKFSNKLKGNIFIGNHSKYVNIFWKDSNTLFIIHDCFDDDIFKKVKLFNGVNIKYVMRQKGVPEAPPP
jgi:hypothetical protein